MRNDQYDGIVGDFSSGSCRQRHGDEPIPPSCFRPDRSSAAQTFSPSAFTGTSWAKAAEPDSIVYLRSQRNREDYRPARHTPEYSYFGDDNGSVA